MLLYDKFHLIKPHYFPRNKLKRLWIYYFSKKHIYLEFFLFLRIIRGKCARSFAFRYLWFQQWNNRCDRASSKQMWIHILMFTPLQTIRWTFVCRIGFVCHALLSAIGVFVHSSSFGNTIFLSPRVFHKFGICEQIEQYARIARTWAVSEPENDVELDLSSLILHLLVFVHILPGDVLSQIYLTVSYVLEFTLRSEFNLN